MPRSSLIYLKGTLSPNGTLVEMEAKAGKMESKAVKGKKNQLLGLCLKFLF